MKKCTFGELASNSHLPQATGNMHLQNKSLNYPVCPLYSNTSIKFFCSPSYFLSHMFSFISGCPAQRSRVQDQVSLA